MESIIAKRGRYVLRFHPRTVERFLGTAKEQQREGRNLAFSAHVVI